MLYLLLTANIVQNSVRYMIYIMDYNSLANKMEIYSEVYENTCSGFALSPYFNPHGF